MIMLPQKEIMLEWSAVLVIVVRYYGNKFFMKHLQNESARLKFKYETIFILTQL